MLGLSGPYHVLCWSAYAEQRAKVVDEARERVQAITALATYLVEHRRNPRLPDIDV